MNPFHPCDSDLLARTTHHLGKFQTRSNYRHARAILPCPSASWFGPHHALVSGMLLAALGVATAASAADWPQWRGPEVDGVTAEDLWPADTPSPRLSEVWRTNIGNGFGTVSVRGDMLYVVGWKEDQDHVYCLQASSGTEIWRRSYAEAPFANMHRGGPAATPAVDADHVYMVSKSGLVKCFDANDGSLKWEWNIPEEFGVSVPSWGFSGSPILLGQAVIIDLGRVIAFNRTTGHVIWKTEDFGSAYSTPVPFQWRQQDLLASFPAHGLVVLDANSGRVVVRHAWSTAHNVNAATPAVHGDQILIASGYGVGAGLFQLEPQRLEPLWQTKELRAQMSSPVLVGNHVYGFDDGRFVCLELATGHRRWMHRGLGKGSFVVAGKHLVVLSEEGRLVIAPASPQGFEQVTELQLFDVDQGWIMPVVANGRIFCRSSNGELAALQLQP